jgi:hypothetical protein
VTSQSRKDFKANLETAEAVLKQGEALAEKDPELFETWIQVGMGLNYSKKAEEEVLAKGVVVAPDYYPLYNQMVYYLTPRWHGSTGDIENFFMKAREMAGKDAGDAIYTRLVDNYLSEFNCHYIASGKMADWQIVDAGHRQLMEQFPESTLYLNAYCKTACWFKKREVAAELFAKIDDKPNYSVWGDEDDDTFRRCRRWATMENMPHPCDDSQNQRLPFNLTPKTIQRYIFIASAGLLFLALIATLVIVIVFGRKHSPPPLR